jgi:RNase_H superfamily
MTEPRILLWDVENSPNLAYVWGKYEQDVLKFEQEWHLLSFAWKWLGEKKTHVLGLDDYPAFKKDRTDDYYLAWDLRCLLDEADITVAHNGDAFDRRKSNARFLIHGFDPPRPSRSVDTLKVARKHFMLNSNKLGDLGETLDLGGKLETGGFKTWLGCMSGDPEAWRLMKKYNRADVVLLEKVYLRLLPWIDGHPNMGLIMGLQDACPKCGATEGFWKRGNRRSVTLSYKVFQCKACGGYVTARESDKNAPRPEYK